MASSATSSTPQLIDRDRDRLPPFSQAFPPLSRPPFRNAVSDSAAFDASQSSITSNRNGKRSRDSDHDRNMDRHSTMDDGDDDDTLSPPPVKSEPPPSPIPTTDNNLSIPPPSKKRRPNNNNSISPEDQKPEDTRKSASRSPDLSKSNSKSGGGGTASHHGGHSPSVKSDPTVPPSPPSVTPKGRSSRSSKQSSEKPHVQTLRTTPSFARSRQLASSAPTPLQDAQQQAQRKFKAAPTDLVISPSASHSSSGGYDRNLAPLIQSAPPVPASRLRLHQMQQQPPTTPSMEPSLQNSRAPLGGGYAHPNLGAGSVGISRIGGQLREKIERDRNYTTSMGVRLTNPPKTASFLSSTMSSIAPPGSASISSSNHAAARFGMRTTVLPPTPIHNANPSHPLVPPTPVSLRHTLNQPLTQARSVSSTSATAQPSTAGPNSAFGPRSPRPPPIPSVSVSQTSNLNPAARSAFLAPFEAFYDSLLDAHQLKTWLADQLTRSQALLQHQQNVNLEEEVARRVAPMREEMDWLRGRVGELEEVVLGLRGGPGAIAASNLNKGAAGKRGGAIMNGGISSSTSGSGNTLQPLGPQISGRKRRSRSRSVDPKPQTAPAPPPTQAPVQLPHSPGPTPTPSPGGSPSPVLGGMRMATSSTRLDPHPNTAGGTREKKGKRGPSPLGNLSGEEKRSPVEGEKEKEKEREREKERNRMEEDD